ncbi:RHTO0S16e03642g1_1 [Rhodotorula toruloides]|uniref:RHTO0S16e03642g1_1 n=1 Tax=Rhodotorula toruloides TaxID=5286 RepID=A0A061BE41_RHOTO|nr:RHTO0S16e03642g1_1 [Rhodotorula toruloides]
MPRAATRAIKATGPLVFDGKPLVPNDHVYVSPPWDDREGEPYLIARVIEILQPVPKAASDSPTPPTTSSSRTVPTTELRVRVGYYFRTRDITNRYVADHRIIVATMHSDTVPASYIRGVCMVKHRDHIEELEVYKREKDTFYWHQLYDRYLHRYFDALPTYKVQNAPAEIITFLQEHFEFVLCEVGTGAELCDAQRGCCVCSRWAANAESVSCARCANVYHLNCVDPPLAAKPKAGYGWSCAPCSRAHDEEVETWAETGLPPPVRKAAIEAAARVKTVAPPGTSQMLHASKKGKAREVGPGVRPDPHDWRMTNGWPYRYFGMHTNAYQILDPHDSLYPRASTRLGNRFQCIVPDWDPVRGQQESTPGPAKQYFQPKRSRASTPLGRVEKDKTKKPKLIEIIPRGEEEAVQVIWRPTDKVSDEALAELFERVKKTSMYQTCGVDVLNRAVSLIEQKEGNVNDTIAALRKVLISSLGHASWNEEEKRKLVEGAQQHHNDIEEIAKMIKTKKMSDVVKRYYVHVGHTLQEDEPQQPEEKATVVATRSGRQSRRRVTRDVFEELEERDDEADDQASIAPPPKTPAQKRNRFCAICETTETEKWYWCPENICDLEVKPNPMVMCENCGIRWRHYGAQYPPYGDELKPVPDKKKDSKKERERVAAEEAKRLAEEAALAAASKEPTPPPPKPVIPPKPCLLCKRFEPKTALFQCDNCTISYHASCYGVDLDYEIPHDEWLCNMCERDKERKPLVLHPHCVLCPPPQNVDPSSPMTALDCLKETELSNYVHSLCAVWHRELQLGLPGLIYPVEGFGSLPETRVNAQCVICKERGVGCTVKCEDCLKHVHVSCAWAAGYKFAFEVQPVRNKKRLPKDTVLLTFKGEEGVLLPCVWCPDHHFTHAERKTYDLGARDQASKMTSLQMYVRNMKGTKHPDAPLLLRQGRRVDSFVRPVIRPKAPTPPPAPGPRPKPKPLLTFVEELAAQAQAQREAELEEQRALEAKRQPKKRRRSSMTPAVVEQQQQQQQQQQSLEGYVEQGGEQTAQEGEMIQVERAEDSPLPGKRVRKPTAPKLAMSPKAPKKSQAKKRKTASFPQLEALASMEHVINGSAQDYASLAHLPPLPPMDGFGAFTPEKMTLPALPVFPDSLPKLPSLPSLPDITSALHFSPATSAPHLLNSLVYTAHIPNPSLSSAPAHPSPLSYSSSLDPALQALTAVAAAEADSREAGQPSTYAHPPQDGANDANGSGEASTSAQAEAQQEQPVEEDPPAQSEPQGDAEDGHAAVEEEAHADATEAEAEADGDDDGTPGRRPRRKVRAPAALRDTTAFSDDPALQQLAQTSPRPRSPAALEPPPLHPILDYVRAHESAQHGFRFDTPDDSDVASDHLNSPGPSSAFGSPAFLPNPLPAEGGRSGGRSSDPNASPSSKARQRRKPRGSSGPSTCANCGTSDSPLFRRDSEGRQLCNSCGLYFKTHGHDRPQKVIQRAIGAARVQKRKQQIESGETPPKRIKPAGIPSPLQAAPHPHAPAQPSPLQPMPAFSYGDSPAYSPEAYAGPSGSGGGGGRRSASASSSATGSGNGLNGTLSSGIAAGYESPYAAYVPPIPTTSQPFDPRQYAGGHHLPQPPQPHQHHPYGHHFPSNPSPTGNASPQLPRPTFGAGPSSTSGHYYDPFGMPPSTSAASTENTVDAEVLQRHALESLAAQALSFGVGPSASAPPTSASQPEQASSAPAETSSAPVEMDVARSTATEQPHAHALAHPAAAQVRAEDAKEQTGQPSPPPSASAMPLAPLFPGDSA